MDQTYQYEFLERWVLPGTTAQVYDALVDFELYPRWGYPTYQSGHREGPPGIGCTGTLVVTGGLPYQLTLHCTITRLVPGREIGISVTGDLVGELVWRIRALSDGTVEVINDWRCNAAWFVIRVLTPVMRPLFRWNHRKGMSLMMSGLTRYLALAPRSPAPPPAERKRAAPARRPRAARPSP